VRTDRNDIVLAAVEGKHRGSSEFVKVNCPFCPERAGKEDRSRSLSLNERTGWWRCFRCDIRGRLTGNFEEHVRDATPTVRRAPPKLPEYIPLWEGDGRTASATAPARAYLRKRGLVDEDVWREAQIGVALKGRFENRIIIPALHHERGKPWLGYVARTWAKHPRPYLNATDMATGTFLYNQRTLDEETGYPALVVEGCFDALAFWPHAVALLGKAKPAQVDILSTARRPVVVVLDGDAWREGWALTAELRLRGVRCGMVKLPPRKDPDEMDHAWLIDEARKSLDAPL
jgi:hypothetical protein